MCLPLAPSGASPLLMHQGQAQRCRSGELGAPGWRASHGGTHCHRMSALLLAAEQELRTRNLASMREPGVRMHRAVASKRGDHDPGQKGSTHAQAHVHLHATLAHGNTYICTHNTRNCTHVPAQVTEWLILATRGRCHLITDGNVPSDVLCAFW